MQPAEIKILSTRPLDSALIEQAAIKEIRITVIPFIATVSVSEDELDVLMNGLADRSFLVAFTSAKAVGIVGNWWKHKKEISRWKIFCIGWSTRTEVEKIFGPGSVIGEADSAADLAKVITRYVIEKKEAVVPGILFFCGDHRRDELPDLLKEQGLQVEEKIVYRTSLKPGRIKEVYDGIIFFSPSAVTSFFSINTADAHTKLFAIGTTTAAAIAEHCKNPIIISTHPDPETLIREVIKYFQKL